MKKAKKAVVSSDSDSDVQEVVAPVASGSRPARQRKQVNYKTVVDSDESTSEPESNQSNMDDDIDEDDLLD